MSATQSIRQRENRSDETVRLLYLCDFPPSNVGGGPILMSRLLKEYPTDRITILTSSRFDRISATEGRLGCEQITVPLSEGYGRCGLGRIRIAFNWLRVPFVALRAKHLIRRRRIAAILTVLHGYFYVATAMAARVTGIPYIIVVHDDYTSRMNRISRWVTRLVLRNAAHVYCVSTGMQEAIRSQFGVESELQWPATEKPRLDSSQERSPELSVVFAGSITAAVEDSLRALAELFVSGKLQEHGISCAKLHLYSIVREDKKQAWGWDHPDIVIHSWIDQSELMQVLQRSDILFLPFSFAPSQKHTVQTAFPSKTADYLASGTPIVVYGPEYSTLVDYAQREGFAEIVSNPAPRLLADAIARIALDPIHRERLSARSLQVFSKYHDISQQRIAFSQLLTTIVHSKPAWRAV